MLWKIPQPTWINWVLIKNPELESQDLGKNPKECQHWIQHVASDEEKPDLWFIGLTQYDVSKCQKR